jgi:hypothetical protein
LPLTDIPLFIANKAIAFSMIIILAIAFVKQNNKKKDECISYLNIFKIFSIIHVLISIVLLSQNYYPKLFSDNKLTVFGSLAVLFGILSITYLTNIKYRIKNLLFYSLVAIHLFFLGFKGWVNIEKWNGMMPPITLICFIILVTLFILSALKVATLKTRKY